MADTMIETKELLPEVQALVTAREAAFAAYKEADAAVHAKYPKRYGWGDGAREAREGYLKEYTAVQKQYNKARNDTWEQLSRSEDPLVRWIAVNGREHEAYAEIVLKALPATLDQLEGLADEHGWCGEWYELRDKAVEDGVIPGHPPLRAAHMAVLKAIDEESCCSFDADQKRRVSGLLDALVAEARAETPQAAAA